MQNNAEKHPALKASTGQRVTQQAFPQSLKIGVEKLQFLVIGSVRKCKMNLNLSVSFISFHDIKAQVGEQHKGK